MLFMLSDAPEPSKIKLRICRICEASNDGEAKFCTQCSSQGLSQTVQAYPSGAILLGKYEIESLLGCGGMGVVYQAKHLTLQRKVAIKCIHPHMVSDREVLLRFQREAMAASAIEHPNVLRVNDLDMTEDGSPLLVTELLVGRDLDRCLRQKELFSAGRIISLLTQTLDALSVAHQKGILHRDLKPANLFMTTDPDGKEQVKIVDFGLAKLLGNSEENLTNHGVSMGTPAYMSPEQVRGEPVDGRADLWSVGVILYQMLTGRLPFLGDSPVSTAMSVLKGDVKDSPLDTPEGPRRELWVICKSAISQDKERRPANAKEFRDRLQAIQLGHANLAEKAGSEEGPRKSFAPWLTAGVVTIVTFVVLMAALQWLQGDVEPVNQAHSTVAQDPQSASKPASQEAKKTLTPASQPKPATPPTTSPKPTSISVQPTSRPKVSATNPTKEPAPTSNNPLEVPAGQTKFSYAKGLMMSGKTKDAATLFAQVTKEEPFNSSAHRWLGDAYLKLGKKSQAVAAWKEVLRIDPGYSESKQLKALIEANQ